MQDICESLRRYRIFLDKKKIKFDKQTKTLIFCHWFFNHQLSTDHPWNEATQFGTLPNTFLSIGLNNEKDIGSGHLLVDRKKLSLLESSDGH